MSYPEEYTDLQVQKLARRIKRVYTDAYKEMSVEATEYFRGFEDSYKSLRSKYAKGELTRLQFNAEVHALVGRGEKWKALREDMAKKATNAAVEAAAFIKGEVPKTFVTGCNFTVFEVEKGSGIAFNIYNEQAVQRLMVENPELFPKTGVSIPKAMKWNRQKLSEALTSAIIQGKTLDKLALSFQTVTKMGEKQAVRNARTAMTGAVNGGRQKSITDITPKARSMGFDIKKEWISCGDARVRDSHAHLDGVRVDPEEAFPNGLMYPADPNGAPSEVYNCRCQQGTVVNGITATRTFNTKESYEEWLSERIDNDSSAGKGKKATYTDPSEIAKKIIAEKNDVKQAKMIRELVGQYMNTKCRWSGIIVYDDKKLNPASYNKDLRIITYRTNKPVPLKSKIHEMVHAYSVEKGKRELKTGRRINEACTETLAEIICDEHHISYKGTYVKYVDAFSYCADKAGLDKKEFAIKLLSTPYNERYNLFDKTMGEAFDKMPPSTDSLKFLEAMHLLYGKV